MPLEEAGVVFAGGWGLGSRETFEALRDLADETGGAVGCTRPVVDAGWAEEDRIIGTSGRVVHPKLYMGFGISGATHHTVGMRDAEVVVSVNTDPAAPVFAVSDYFVVADARDVIAALLSGLGMAKQS